MLLSTLAVLACASAPSQTPVQAGDTTELVSASPADGRADHETIAINSKGDVFVTWSSSVYSLLGAQPKVRRVEGAFLRRTGPTTWDLYDTITLGEADPTLLPGGVSVFSQGDICRKPDVVAMGDHFVVAWQRLENADSSNGQVELALIEVPASGDAIAHLQDPLGIGYVIDQFDPTGAGGMVDLACAPGTTEPIVVAYAHKTLRQVLVGGERLYDFDVRAMSFSFPTVGAAPSLGPVNTLATDIAFDDFAPGDPNTGRVLPDCVFDVFGNVVIGFEEFRRGDRISGTTPHDGQIHLRRYAIDGAGIFSEVNATTLRGSDDTFAQRRPMLFRSPSNVTLDLSWGEIKLPSDETEIYHFEVAYPTATDDAVFTDYAPSPLPFNANAYGPVPFQYKNAHGVVVSTDLNPGAFNVGYQLSARPDWELLRGFVGLQPWRPAIDVLENDPLRPNRGVVSLANEGRASFFSQFSRIYLQLLTI